MKEYEYMVLVTDEIFSHIITSVICLENYTRSDLSGAFRKLFSLYNELREEYYELKRDVKEIPEEVQDAQLLLRSRCKREEIIESYIVELENIDPSIDYRRLLDELYQKMEKEDTEDLEMQLMIYPYLLSSIVTDYETVKAIKNSERGCVSLLQNKQNGTRFIFRHYRGNGEVYRKLVGISCPNLPQNCAQN